MKLTNQTAQQQNTAVFILVDAEHVQNIAKPFQNLIQHTQFNGTCQEILPAIAQCEQTPICYFVGLGQANQLKRTQIVKLAQNIIKTAQNKYESIDIQMQQLPAEFQELFARTLTQENYGFDEFKSTKLKTKLNQINFVQSTLSDAQLCLIEATQNGQNLARDLGNRPGNICYPEYLAQLAIDLANEFPQHLKVTILDEEKMTELGMGAFLAVSKGSDRPGRIITLEYNSERTEAPIVLVGKGVTFDTGGISLKPGAGMDEMKFDMCGAASVFGTMRALCEANLPVHVVGTIAAAENMPSAHATRPGDIVKTMSGQTVEILNTDAEGRLVLCDALTYVKRFNPAVVVDIATLTGACVVALGKVVSGLFSQDQNLIAELQQAGEQSFDRVWSMPVMEEYQELLNSPFADIANIGGPQGGSITAACFLQRFTQDYPWAHLDIAGTAWFSGAQKGATGRPVPLLMQFIQNRIQHD